MQGFAPAALIGDIGTNLGAAVSQASGSPLALGGAAVIGYLFFGRLVFALLRLIGSIGGLLLSYPVNVLTGGVNRLTYMTRRYGPFVSYYLSRPLAVCLLVLGGYIVATKISTAEQGRSVKAAVAAAPGLQCSGEIIDLACPKKR